MKNKLGMLSLLCTWFVVWNQDVYWSETKIDNLRDEIIYKACDIINEWWWTIDVKIIFKNSTPQIWDKPKEHILRIREDIISCWESKDKNVFPGANTDPKLIKHL